MAQHDATIAWSNDDPEGFAKGTYSRAHRWTFDGGAVVAASASPSVVRPPWSVPAGVDPEEAFVASLSSCHMLWFLDLARRAGHVLADYEDEAQGTLEKCADGKVRMTRVTLRPRIAFVGPAPDAAALDALHHGAHEACFIANSTTATVVIEPR
jgi:organic hydroperoxide reductase OsmC/OhrA